MYANRGSSDLTLAEPRYCSPSKALFCNCLSPEIFYSAAARLQSLVQRGSREQGLASMYPKWLQRLACTQLFNCIIFIFIFLKGNPYTWVEVWCDPFGPFTDSRTTALSQDADYSAGRDGSSCVSAPPFSWRKPWCLIPASS